MTRRLVFDIETNGLLDVVDRVHCLVIQDYDTGEMWSCASHEHTTYHTIEFGLELLRTADVVIAHNGLGYDKPALQIIYPDFVCPLLEDTLVEAKMIWPAESLRNKDIPRWKKGDLPGQLIGRQSLEAWGYRLGEMKGEYQGDPDIADEKERKATKWDRWNRSMQDYCEQDIRSTVALYKLIRSHLEGTHPQSKGFVWSERSLRLEHDLEEHVRKQEARGFGFNMKEAVKLAATLKNRKAELETKLVARFGSWWQPLDPVVKGTLPAIDRKVKRTEWPDVTMPRVSEKTGKELKPYVGPPLETYSTDAPFVRIAHVEFNPGSRHHLADRLTKLYGWKPKEFGGRDGTEPKLDETVIKTIPEGVLPADVKADIMEFYVVSKTLAQLAEGKKNWISLARDGRIHGRVDPLGTTTHRAAHSNPNTGQVPAVSVEEEKDEAGKVVKKTVILGYKGGFGFECRSLFGPSRHPHQTGTDASGLQLRIMGHYLEPYDGGEFAERVADPDLDIHEEHGKLTDLPRSDTKTVTYTHIFGGGPALVGYRIGVKPEEIDELAASPAVSRYLQFVRKKMGRAFQEPDKLGKAQIGKGILVKRKFVAGLTGVGDLTKDTIASAKQGFIEAIDGRKIIVAKPHAAFAALLQSGDAIISKMWQLELDRMLRAEGFVEDRDYGQMAWVHDELQFEHIAALSAIIGELSDAAIKRVGKMLDFRGVLAAEAKPGTNWAECH